jgi:hypothetical protein
MSDVPTAYLDGMEIKLRKTLRKIVKKGVNIERMRDIIDRNILGVRFDCCRARPKC